MKKSYSAIALIMVIFMLAGLVAYVGVQQQSVVPVVEKEASDPGIILKQVQGLKADYLIQCFDDPRSTKDCTAVLKAGDVVLRVFGVPRCAVDDAGGQFTSRVSVSKAVGELIEADGTVVVGKPVTLASDCTKVTLQKYTIVQRVECNADVDCRVTATSNVYRTLLGKCVENVETDPVCVYKGVRDAEAKAAQQKTFVYTHNLIPWYAGAAGMGILAGGAGWLVFRRKRKR